MKTEMKRKTIYARKYYGHMNMNEHSTQNTQLGMLT